MFENSINTILFCAITTMITRWIASETRGGGSGGPNFMFCPRAQCELVRPLYSGLLNSFAKVYRSIRPKKKSQVYGHPTDPNFWPLIFGPDPKVFINIFLFLIKSCIMLFVVCQTRLGSLGVF